MFNLPREDPSSVADWVELELALNSAIDSLSKATVSTTMEQGIGNSPTEGFLTDVWRLLERREKLYKDSPFHVEGNLVLRSQGIVPPETYLACLFFSLYGVRTKRSDPKLLERIAGVCIADYIGGKSYIFGWPPIDDVPIQIQERIKHVANALRERLAEEPRAKYKDRGVDVITWKPFELENAGAHRSGQVAILSQCAAGQDWAKKTGDVPMKAWEQYIHWANAPMPGFVVPGVVDDEQNWHDLSVECGLVFDRARIYNHSPNPFPDPALIQSINDWIQAEVQEATT